MKNNESSVLLEALAVTCELTNTHPSATAVQVMAADLAQYPEAQVLGALTRCRREVRSNLSVADIIARLDDGRPGPEEAWSICAPTLADEGPTVVRTDEMALAFGVALGCAHDRVAARMAFLEAYRSACMAARAQGIPVKWTPSLGLDSGGREGPLLAAVAAGKIEALHAQSLLPHLDALDPQAQRVLGMVDQKRIGAPRSALPDGVRTALGLKTKQGAM